MEMRRGLEEPRFRNLISLRRSTRDEPAFSGSLWHVAEPQSRGVRPLTAHCRRPEKVIKFFPRIGGKAFGRQTHLCLCAFARRVCVCVCCFIVYVRVV